jgi:RHS repeat-associated protein
VGGVATIYTLMNGMVTQETNGTNNIIYRYDTSGTLISMNIDGTEYYYFRNTQGDIMGLFDNTGAMVVEYTYDAWGNILSTAGSLASTVGVLNPYRYRGYRYDNESGLYYLQSRYYNPVWGRFINTDTDIGTTGYLLSHNIFIYCNNNPINLYDPNGNDLELVAAIFGIAVCAIFTAMVVNMTAYYTSRGMDVEPLPSVPSMHADDNNNYNDNDNGNNNDKNNKRNNKRNDKRSGGHNYQSARSNSQANEWARRVGYENAESLKEAFVGKGDISRFNMLIDKDTREIILERITTKAKVLTGLFLK